MIESKFQLRYLNGLSKIKIALQFEIMNANTHIQATLVSFTHDAYTSSSHHQHPKTSNVLTIFYRQQILLILYFLCTFQRHSSVVEIIAIIPIFMVEPLGFITLTIKFPNSDNSIGSMCLQVFQWDEMIRHSKLQRKLMPTHQRLHIVAIYVHILRIFSQMSKNINLLIYS